MLHIEHVLVHSAEDTAKMLPFLFVAYLFIEYLERKKSESIQQALAAGGRFGFVPGAALGLLPQCGFSAVAANFYASRVISLGTLIAVFLSTSDEAIPIMLSTPNSYGLLAKLLLFKFLYAVFVGFFLDTILKRFIPTALQGYGGQKGPQNNGQSHAHHEKDGIFLAAAKHTALVIITVFAITFAFGMLVEFMGEENISGFLSSLGLFQPFVAGLLGLVPNCAVSILLSQLYLAGNISFGSVFAGLCTGSGVGLAVLYRTNKNTKQNLFITALLLFSGVFMGLILHVFAF